MGAFNRIREHWKGLKVGGEQAVYDGGFSDFMKSGIKDWLK